MSAIIRQLDKRSGITYAYESISYWDKEKKQSRAKRRLIGRFDLSTGKIIPTRKKGSETSLKLKPGASPITNINRFYYGATYLFDEIGKQTGITEDLKKCFPDNWKKILSIAYYLILEDKNPLYRFSKWSKIHRHPFGNDISSQRSSELFAQVSEEDKERFFILQAKRRAENEFWAYDTTSISSYSEALREVRYGHNKDNDPLPQINLALLFGQISGLPFYYRKLPGNITDAKTVKNLLADMNFLGYEDVSLVMDRGFSTRENINALLNDRRKFLIGAKRSQKFVMDGIASVKSYMQDIKNYSEKYDLYALALPVKWNYEIIRPYKKDSVKAERRMYLHIYYNPEKAVDDERTFNRKIITLKEELLRGRNIEHQKQYETYFDVIDTPKREIKVSIKRDAVIKAKSLFGYFALISNKVKDAISALEIYRNKDLVEKSFGNLKERLNFRRPLVSSEESLEGKIFVEFVALIHLSYIKKKMEEKDLFKKFTMQELLDEFDVIECFERPGHKLRVGEMTLKQIGLYEEMGITPPRYV